MDDSRKSRRRSVSRIAGLAALLAVIVVIAATWMGISSDDGRAQTTGQETPTAAQLPVTAVASPDASPAASPAATPDQARTGCDAAWTPKPTPESAVVAADEVKLRVGPGVTCRTIETLPEGTRVDVLSEMVVDDSGNIWSRVRVVETGTEGWMGFTFLNLDS